MLLFLLLLAMMKTRMISRQKYTRKTRRTRRQVSFFGTLKFVIYMEGSFIKKKPLFFFSIINKNIALNKRKFSCLHRSNFSKSKNRSEVWRCNLYQTTVINQISKQIKNKLCEDLVINLLFNFISFLMYLSKVQIYVRNTHCKFCCLK